MSGVGVFLKLYVLAAGLVCGALKLLGVGDKTVAACLLIALLLPSVVLIGASIELLRLQARRSSSSRT